MSHTRLALSSTQQTQPLLGSVRVPGDRRIARLALMLAGLAVGESRIAGLPEWEDVSRMTNVMRDLGAEVARDVPGAWRVAGRGVGGLREPQDVLHMGDCRAAAQLLCGILASHDLFAILTGNAGLRRRPLRWLTELLQSGGAQFHGAAGGCLPLAIQGARDAPPIAHSLPREFAPAKSALLLAGLNAPGWTRIEQPEPTLDHTERMLRHFGATVLVESAGAGCVTSVMGQPELRATDVVVPGDPSLAAFPLVAALIVPGSVVTVRGMGLNPLRTGLFATLREMGARLDVTQECLDGHEPTGDMTATYTGLRGVEVPVGAPGGMQGGRAQNIIDDIPILAVAAACATGATRLRCRAGPRIDENRGLPAVAAMLTANGVQAEIVGDDLIVHGAARPAGGGQIATGTASAIAMSGLILGLRAARPVRADDAIAIEASFPGFAPLLRGLGASIA